MNTREWFQDKWIEYIKTHSDKEWSKHHKEFIDALFSNNIKLTKEQVKKLKG